MQLRDALDDVKRTEGQETLFPGERRTTTGLFSGRTATRAERPAEARLVHVSPGGATTDFGYPLSGLTGIDRSRFGLRFGDGALDAGATGTDAAADERSAAGESDAADGASVDGDTPADDADADGSPGAGEGVVWFDDCETVEQSYYGETALVVTEFALPDGRGSVTQYDLTVDDAHLTHVALDLDADSDPVGGAGAETELVAFYGFSPDGRDTRVGQLRHEAGVELFHADEHDFLGSATGFVETEGRVPTRFDELLRTDPVDLPRGVDADRYEEGKLSGNLVCRVPFEEGTTTLATLLTDRDETPRVDALDRLEDLTTYDDAEALERAAEAQVEIAGRGPRPEAAAADLRVLSLLSATTGLRIAGPDFDPYYAHSGGYGYTWFRDDAEISLFLLRADRRFDLGLDAWHARSARSYCATQREDGSWPHRVWPFDGRLAPGWANGRLESGHDTDYQADQTGSVVTFLSRALDDGTLRASGDAADVRWALAAALDGLDETLAEDGLPVPCQNAWEDTTGRFSHTAATFLEAYAAAAETDALDDDRADSAAASAERVYDALDDLWIPERGAYAFRLVPEPEYDEAGEVEFEAGAVDDCIDSASLALVAAHHEYDRLDAGGVDDDRLDRLVSHVETVFDELYRDPEGSEVEGLVRYEGDPWRQRSQAGPKVWTVSTAWGANAAAHLAALLDDHDDPRADEFAERARELLALVLPDGPLSTNGGYLPEQFFDDGEPDSATPLGWPHALRLATVALLDERGMLDAPDGRVDAATVGADDD